jgi:hypothetical protein
MKIIGFAGVLLGIVGSIYIIILGIHDIYGFGLQTSEHYNGVLFTTYGTLFLVIYLFTMWLMNKRYWKSSLSVDIACTIFSILGLFSIGPFLFLGSFIILVQSFINVLKSRS